MNGIWRSSTKIVIAEPEPVVVVGELVRGDLDAQRVAGLPVVGRVAADLELDLRLAGQQRQHLGAEPHRVEAAKPDVRRARPQAELSQGLLKLGQQRLLTVVVAERPAFGGVGRVRLDRRRLSPI